LAAESDLLKISVAMSIMGIIIIAYTVYNYEPSCVNISSLRETDVGKIYYLSGSIESVFVKNDTAFIQMSEQDKKINVVMFSDVLEKNPIVYDISRGENVTMKGKVQMYKGALEIIAFGINVADD
jgi:hypothetical protein